MKLSDLSVIPNRIVSILFKPICIDCGAFVESSSCSLVCANCAAATVAIARKPGSRCVKCSQYLYRSKAPVCQNCKRYDHPFGRNVSLFDYRDPVIHKLVHLFKFESNLRAGRDLAELIRRDCDVAGIAAGYDLVTAVPVSRGSLKRRGFDQTAFVLDRLEVQFESLLVRKEHEVSQSSLTAAERRSSIAGQFTLVPEATDAIRGKKVLLIDDIYTTGVTCGECSRILLDAEAVSVDTLTFFRS